MLAISLSREEFKWVRKSALSNEKYACIRIGDSATDLAEISERLIQKVYEAELQLLFSDNYSAVMHEGMLLPAYDAVIHQKVIEFVEQHKDCDLLYVHCGQGICRSAAIVKGLAKLFNWVTARHGLDGEQCVYPSNNVLKYFEKRED